MADLIKVETGAIAEATEHYQIMIAFVRQAMKANQDYGIIPGTNGKPTLLKPGAEKLCRLFSLRPHFELVSAIADFDKPLFHYHYRCTLYNRHGEALGQGEGNCNSREKRYEKQQHKVFDLANTICKIAQKRSLIAAVLVVCGASEFFTQDRLDEDDAQSQPQSAPKTPNSITDAQVKRFQTIARGAGYTVGGGKALLREWGLTSSRQITRDIYDRICVQAASSELAVAFNEKANQSAVS